MADDNNIIHSVWMPASGPPPGCARCRAYNKAALQTPELGTVCLDCLTEDEYEEFLRDVQQGNRARSN